MDTDGNSEIYKRIYDAHARVKKVLECPICFQSVEKMCITKCNHFFCDTCMEKVMKMTSPKCSLCQSPLNRRNFAYNQDISECVKYCNELTKAIEKDMLAYHKSRATKSPTTLSQEKVSQWLEKDDMYANPIPSTSTAKPDPVAKKRAIRSKTTEIFKNLKPALKEDLKKLDQEDAQSSGEKVLTNLKLQKTMTVQCNKILAETVKLDKTWNQVKKFGKEVRKKKAKSLNIVVESVGKSRIEEKSIPKTVPETPEKQLENNEKMDDDRCQIKSRTPSMDTSLKETEIPSFSNLNQEEVNDIIGFSNKEIAPAKTSWLTGAKRVKLNLEFDTPEEVIPVQEVPVEEAKESKSPSPKKTKKVNVVFQKLGRMGTKIKKVPFWYLGSLHKSLGNKSVKEISFVDLDISSDSKDEEELLPKRKCEDWDSPPRKKISSDVSKNPARMEVDKETQEKSYTNYVSEHSGFSENMQIEEPSSRISWREKFMGKNDTEKVDVKVMENGESNGGASGYSPSSKIPKSAAKENETSRKTNSETSVSSLSQNSKNADGEVTKGNSSNSNVESFSPSSRKTKATAIEELSKQSSPKTNNSSSGNNGTPGTYIYENGRRLKVSHMRKRSCYTDLVPDHTKKIIQERKEKEISEKTQNLSPGNHGAPTYIYENGRRLKVSHMRRRSCYNDVVPDHDKKMTQERKEKEISEETNKSASGNHELLTVLNQNNRRLKSQMSRRIGNGKKLSEYVTKMLQDIEERKILEQSKTNLSKSQESNTATSPGNSKSSGKNSRKSNPESSNSAQFGTSTRSYRKTRSEDGFSRNLDSIRKNVIVVDDDDDEDDSDSTLKNIHSISSESDTTPVKKNPPRIESSSDESEGVIPDLQQFSEELTKEKIDDIIGEWGTQQKKNIARTQQNEECQDDEDQVPSSLNYSDKNSEKSAFKKHASPEKQKVDENVAHGENDKLEGKENVTFGDSCFSVNLTQNEKMLQEIEKDLLGPSKGQVSQTHLKTRNESPRVQRRSVEVDGTSNKKADQVGMRSNGWKNATISSDDEDIVENTPQMLVKKVFRSPQPSSPKSVLTTDFSPISKEHQAQPILLSQPNDQAPEPKKKFYHSTPIIPDKANKITLKTGKFQVVQETPEEEEESQMVIVCSNLNLEQIGLVKNFARKFGATYQQLFSSRMTHLIMRTINGNEVENTLKYIQAVAYGKWVLSMQWIQDSMKENKILDEEDYEVVEACSGDPGPRRSRLREKNIFEEFAMYCPGPFSAMTTTQCQELVKCLGGVTANSLEELSKIKGKTKIIIVQNDCHKSSILNWCKKTGAAAVEHEWLMECIGVYKLIPVTLYLQVDKSFLESINYPKYLLLDDEPASLNNDDSA